MQSRLMELFCSAHSMRIQEASSGGVLHFVMLQLIRMYGSIR